MATSRSWGASGWAGRRGSGPRPPGPGRGSDERWSQRLEHGHPTPRTSPRPAERNVEQELARVHLAGYLGLLDHHRLRDDRELDSGRGAVPSCRLARQVAALGQEVVRGLWAYLVVPAVDIGQLPI